MNNLLAKLKESWHKGYVQGITDGRDFTLSLLTVTLNELYNFGNERINATNTKMQELWDKEFKDDPETGARHLMERIEQIKHK